MLQPCALLPDGISEMFADASTTGKLTLADRYGLLAAILMEQPSEEDLVMINRLFHALKRGHLSVVNELSNCSH